MKQELINIINTLKETFKDHPELGIYTAQEANDLYKEKVDPTDWLVDDEYVDTTLVITPSFNNENDDNHNIGSYYLELHEGDIPCIICMTYPDDPIYGLKNIEDHLRKSLY